jgi:hypothetical protein
MKIFLISSLIFILTACSDNSSDVSGLISTASESIPSSDTTAPILISSNNPISGTYIYENSISFTFDFDEAVFVSGSPQVEITIDGVSKFASLDSGDGTTSLTFSYIVEEAQTDLDGVEYQAIYLNGGEIKDAANNFADLSLFTSGSLGAVNIDSVRPSADTFEIDTFVGFTTTTAITLNMTSTGATQMYITNDPTCLTGGSWEPILSSKAYTLNPNILNEIYFITKNATENKSDCLSVSIVHDDQNPNAPGTISLLGNGSDIASNSSSWTSALDIGPAGLEKYEYAVSTTVDEAGIVAGGSWVDSLTSSFQIESGLSLVGSTDYYVLVRAVDNAGNKSNISVSSAWQIIVSPEAVTNLESSSTTTESISLGWSYPEDNGTAITDYYIYVKGGTYTDWTVIADGVSIATNYNHAGLDAETSYQYKMRAFNGINFSGWSNTLAVETLPDLAFFAPGFKAINIAGATANQVVSFDDSNDIYLNGVLVATLNKHETHAFTGADFDVLEGTKAFFVAGRGGSGSDTTKMNAVWSTGAWVGKDFIFNHNRSTPMKVKVFAFEASTVTIKQGGTTVATQAIAADSGYTFSLTTYASYTLESDGYVVAYTYANQGGTYYIDPKPLLPSSTDIIGLPSNAAKVSSATNSNGITMIRTNSALSSATVNSSSIYTTYGTGAYFTGDAMRIISTDPIVANSYADSDGGCSAPFLPVSMVKKRYGLNVESEWAAFASDRPVTITITKPDLTTSTITLTKSGVHADAPYKAYLSADYPAGTLFESTNPFAAWYEPKNDTNAGDNDETIMFGWD